jgi:hypothetical protein
MIVQVKMTIDEALEYADEWAQGTTFHEESQGWRVVCAILALEVRRLNGEVKDSIEDANRLKKENLVLNLQLLNIEQNFIELKTRVEGLALQNELLRKELG